MFKKFIRDHKIHKNVVSFSFFDYIFLYKPIYLFGPIAIVLSGMYLANFSNSQLDLGVTVSDLNTSLFILGVSIIVSCIFIKNEIISIVQDSNVRFNFIEKNLIGDRINIKTAQIIHNYSLSLGFLLILITSWINLFIIATVYFLWIYSIDNSVDVVKKICFNAIIAFFLIFSGWLYADNSFNSSLQFILFFLLSLPYVCFFFSNNNFN